MLQHASSNATQCSGTVNKYDRIYLQLLFLDQAAMGLYKMPLICYGVVGLKKAREALYP